jgi:hypothetical protein
MAEMMKSGGKTQKSSAMDFAKPQALPEIDLARMMQGNPVMPQVPRQQMQMQNLMQMASGGGWGVPPPPQDPRQQQQVQGGWGAKRSLMG